MTNDLPYLHELDDDQTRLDWWRARRRIEDMARERGVIAGGAVFPGIFTAVIDNANRANGGAGANWTAFVTTGAVLNINTNQFAASAADYALFYWNANSYGPDCEVYADVPTLGPWGLEILSDTTLNTQDSYELSINDVGANDFSIYRYDNGTGTQIKNTTQALSAGDSAGLEKIAGNLSGYRKTGGTWSMINTIVDTTYATATFRLGMYLGLTTVRTDNFSGGNVPHRLAAQGAGS